MQHKAVYLLFCKLLFRTDWAIRPWLSLLKVCYLTTLSMIPTKTTVRRWKVWEWVWSSGGMILTAKAESLGERPVYCQFAHQGMVWDWPRTSTMILVDCSWNVMEHGDVREGKWRGNWRMEWVASTLHTTSEHGVSSITTADAHTSAASSRLNWRPCRFKWTRPSRRKTKSGFCACAITFQLVSTYVD